VISKFDPLEKILGEKWGTGVGSSDTYPRGIYSLQRRIFPVDPYRFAAHSKITQNCPATVVIFAGTDQRASSRKFIFGKKLFNS